MLLGSRQRLSEAGGSDYLAGWLGIWPSVQLSTTVRPFVLIMLILDVAPV